MFMETSFKMMDNGDHKPASCLRTKGNSALKPSGIQITWNQNDRTFFSSFTSCKVREEVRVIAKEASMVSEASFIGSLDPKVVSAIEKGDNSDERLQFKIGSLDLTEMNRLDVSGKFDYFDDDDQSDEVDGNASKKATKVMGLQYEKSHKSSFTSSLDLDIVNEVEKGHSSDERLQFNNAIGSFDPDATSGLDYSGNFEYFHDDQVDEVDHNARRDAARVMGLRYEKSEKASFTGSLDLETVNEIEGGNSSDGRLQFKNSGSFDSESADVLDDSGNFDYFDDDDDDGNAINDATRGTELGCEKSQGNSLVNYAEDGLDDSGNFDYFDDDDDDDIGNARTFGVKMKGFERSKRGSLGNIMLANHTDETPDQARSSSC